MSVKCEETEELCTKKDDEGSFLNSLDIDSIGRRFDRGKTNTYLGLLRTNHPFRLFFLSYVTNHLGEWFTYIANISAIEMLQPEQSKTAVSVLLAVRLFPNVLFLPLGGVLADGRDRRKSMIALDLLGAVIALLFLVAVRVKSIALLYTATFVQACLSSLYEPSRSSIVTLLTPNEDMLQKATNLTEISWSVVAALGSAAGGYFVSTLGVESCYSIDSATYVVSAVFMSCIGGKWDVSTSPEKSAADSPFAAIKGMLFDGVKCLFRSHFGMLVLVNPSMGLIWGACDILSVSFSESGSTEGRSTRLGLLFASTCVGCILGPLLTERYTNMQAPTSMQRLCLFGMVLISSGMFFMALWSEHFAVVCFFHSFRAMGSMIVWVNASLLLRKLTSPDMLGRVTSIELATTVFLQILSTLCAGALLDDAGWTPRLLSFALAGMGALLLLPWTIYHLQGRGAGAYERMQLENGRHSSPDALPANESTPLVDAPALNPRLK